MAVIDTQGSDVRSAFTQAVNGGKTAAPRPEVKSETGESNASPDRTKLDTVTLSEGGQKIVNLGRGLDLGKEITNAPVDENFAETLEKSTDDVFRITQLFTQTIKSAFNWLR